MMLFLLGFGAMEFVHAFKDVLEVWPGQIVALVMESAHGR
jgi:hypothetical protein